MASEAMDLTSLQTWLGLVADTPGGIIMYTPFWMSPCKKELFTSSWCKCQCLHQANTMMVLIVISLAIGEYVSK